MSKRTYWHTIAMTWMLSTTAVSVVPEVVYAQQAKAAPSQQAIHDDASAHHTDAAAIASAPLPTPSQTDVLVHTAEKVVATLRGDVASPDDELEELSYGSWKYSILFSGDDNDRIQKVLRSFELGLEDAQAQTEDKKNGLDETVDALLQEAEKTGVLKTVRLPSFHLHSIMYSSAHQWSLWLNTHLIANDTPDAMQGVEVVSILPDRAAFKWTLPQDAVAAVKAKKKPQKVAKSKQHTDDALAVAPNRLAQASTAIRYDEKEHAYYFTLKANQVFVSDSERIYEGIPQGVDLVPLEQMYSEKTEKTQDTQKAEDSAGATPSSSVNKDEAIVKALEEKISPKAQIIKALGGEVPVNSAIPDDPSK